MTIVDVFASETFQTKNVTAPWLCFCKMSHIAAPKFRTPQCRNDAHGSAEKLHLAVPKCLTRTAEISYITYIRYISHIACRKSQCRSVAYRRAEISHITMAKSCISQCRNTAYRSAEISHIAMAQCRLSIYRNDIGDDKLSMIMIISMLKIYW